MTLLIYTTIACIAGILSSWYITSNKWKLAYNTLQIQLEEAQQKVAELKSDATTYQDQELTLVVSYLLVGRDERRMERSF